MNWANLLQKQPEQITIEFSSGPRTVVMLLRPDGSVLVRSYGGPVYHMGRPVTSAGGTVSYWDMGHSTLRERLVQALLDDGFPFEGEQVSSLIPDEIPSSMKVYITPSEACGIFMPRRFFDTHPALKKLSDELDSFCYKTQVTARTGSMPNPELHLWPQ